MSKIIVITFTNAVDNYGQVLQYYATQEFLSRRGHDVFVHINKASSQPQTLSVCIKKVKRKVFAIVKKALFSNLEKSCVEISAEDREKQAYFERWERSIEYNEKIHPRNFQSFKNEHFHQIICSVPELKAQDFDAVCVGSDQTWSWVGEYNFLSWCPRKVKKISIAPSVGHKIFSQKEIDFAKPMLRQFDWITVREDNGVKFCRDAGRNDAIKVLDPSFLISALDYYKIETSHSHKKPFIFLYLLGGEIGVEVSELFKYAEKENLDVVYVASQGREDDYPKCYAEIGEWLSLFRDAKYVFTNSFHGMAFSIIYHKKFLVFPLVGIMKGMNERIENLSRLFNLESNIYHGDMDAVKSVADYDHIQTVISHNNLVLDSLLSKIGL